MARTPAELLIQGYLTGMIMGGVKDGVLTALTGVRAVEQPVDEDGIYESHFFLETDTGNRIRVSFESVDP